MKVNSEGRILGRKVLSRGPEPCDVMLIGEAPGYWEEQQGTVFVGDTGKELSRYCKQAGLTDDPWRPEMGRNSIAFLRDINLSNVVKYRPVTRKDTGNDPPTPEDIARDEGELIDEIQRVRPKFIGAVGAVSARWLLGSQFHGMEDCYGLPFPLSKRRARRCGYDISEQVLVRGVEEEGIRSVQHSEEIRNVRHSTARKRLPAKPSGVARKTSVLAEVPWVIPLFHPAAGFHSSGTQPFIYDGIKRLGQYVRGELPLIVPIDQYPDPDYREITGSSVYLMKSCPVYIDTEGLLGRAWGLSFTQTPGNAAVIRISNKKALASFRDQLRGMRVVAHHWIHDAPIIAELFGMTVMELFKWIGGPADDTMVKAFVLRMPPLALKPAGRRYHGMAMEHYLDVVRDADHLIATQYLKQLLKSKCTVCGGDGESLVRPVSEKTGKPLMPQVVICRECEGDGTDYPSPDEYLEYENGKVKVKRGERLGKRVRRVLKDLRLKPETDPRERWERVPYEYRLKIEDRAGEMRPVSLNDVVPQKRAVDYSARDADATCRYDATLDDMLDADEKGKLRQVYEIDRNALPLLIRMMEVGTLVDVPFLGKVATRLETENDRILYKLERLVGHYVNPGSSLQVANLLFDEMQLPVIKMTKGGDQESTADGVLEDLKLQVAGWPETDRRRDRSLKVLNFISDWRERDKLRGTYAVKLPRMVDKNGRIHTTFGATNTESGRYSSYEPNLQNIPDPKKSELGGLIRSAFIAPPGYLLVEVDFGQVEVRFAAHDSEDERLLHAIRNGLDVHTQTATMLFNIPAEQVTKHQRRVSKTITFSILYGITAQSLRARLKIETGIDFPEQTCQGFIDRYLQIAYPGIGIYILDQQAFARRYGYSESFYGRRRYLPGIHSVIRKVRTESERIAVNHRVQGSCADIMKRTAPEVLDEVLPSVRKAGWDCDPLLTVHDAYVLQVKCGGEEMLIERMRAAMVRQGEGLRVKLTVDGHADVSWGAMSAA